MTGRCPEPQAIEAALDSSDGRFDAHFGDCSACAAHRDAWHRLRTLAQAIPVPPLDEARVRRVREALRAGDVPEVDASAPAAPARRRRATPTLRSSAPWVIALAACAASAAVSIWTFGAARSNDGSAGHRAPESESAGSLPSAALAESPERSVARVHVHPGTSASHLGAPGDELVRLVEGAVTVHVRRLEAGERFRVVTGDAQVEVRGTAFDVRATGDRLEQVRVFEGRVEVRADGRPLVELVPGATWTRPPEEMAASQPPASAPHGPAPSPGRPVASKSGRVRTAAPGSIASQTDFVAPAPAPELDPTPPTPANPPGPMQTDSAWRDAWTDLQAGRPARAASGFEGVLTRAPDGPLAEDARYWRAVALARSGDPGGAAGALNELLERHPGSPRAGEASVMLAWLALERDRFDEAERRFGAAVNDRSSRVRDAARKGLAEVTRRRRGTSEGGVGP